MKHYKDADEILRRLPNDLPYKASVKRVLIQAPDADVVEVRYAYWKATTHITVSKKGREIHSKLYNCSNCDAPNGRKRSSYCHWCGAKMDGERREDETKNLSSKESSSS